MTKKIAQRQGGGRPSALRSLNAVSLALAGLGLIGLVGLLGGCSSKGTTYAGGAPDSRLGNPDEIPDAVPRVEPKSKYGNMDSYVVRGRRYYTKDSSDGHVERGLASWYGPYFHRRKTSSGERYDMYAMTAAHKTLPLPTYARVTNIENGRSAVVKINDRGPFHGPRIIDLSYAAATKLGVVRKGTAMVEVRAIDPARRDSDPGPFLAAKKAGVPAPMLADNEPRSRSSMFGDDAPWSGTPTRARSEPRSRSSTPRDDEPQSRAPALASNQAPSSVSLAGEDDWLEGTRIVEESTASFAARAESFDASSEPEFIPRAETRERAYESALAALDATPDQAPAPAARAEPAVRSAPRVSAPIERVAAPVNDAPELAVVKRNDRVSAPIERVAAPMDDAPELAAVERRGVPEVSAPPRKAAPKAVVAAKKDAPKVAAADKKDRSTVTVAATAKKDASRVSAADKTDRDAIKVAAAKKEKDSVKVAAAKKDSPKVAASGKKDGAKTAVASKTDGTKVAATAKKDAPKVAAGKGVYLQVGAFGDRGNAERLRKRLSPHVAGQVRVQSPASPGSSLYKVRVGPFGSEGEARKASAKLASLGVGESRRVVN